MRGSRTCVLSPTRAGMVFADVLKRADPSRGRGVTCERAYDGLGE
jgi:hypothetical protein